MIRLKCLWLAFLLATASACTNSITNTDESNITVRFRLVDSSGTETTIFSVGEAIWFEYLMTNDSEQNYRFQIPDTGPFVSFNILQNGSLLGTSDDGVAYALVIVQDTLEVDSTISHNYNWFSTGKHRPLPQGIYTARVIPRLAFEDIATPGSIDLRFEIVCEMNNPVCDTSPVVRITDEPPSSLQLHQFDLNSVEVKDDSLRLNISYSGGCETHDFILYMSPAAFLESNPVQANLFLWHDDHNDACDAYLTQDVVFSIRPIADLYRKQYGGTDEIILNIFRFFDETPGEHLSASYLPE